MKKTQLVIIGGGAAGMFAALTAADRGIRSVLVERKARLGSKVLMTANGRCNFTKEIAAEQFLKDIGGCAQFVRSAILGCPPRKIISLFKSLGVPLRRMSDGRMFPADGKASTIVHAFGDALRDAGVPMLMNCPVAGIRRGKEADGARWVVDCGSFEMGSDNVLIATGGVSYPKTGSVGDGQNFARSLGHKLTPYRPGLIGLECTDRRVVALAGRRFEDGRAKVLDANGRVLYDYRGEVDCERFGLAGAAIYNCQRFMEHSGGGGHALEVWFERNRIVFKALRARPIKEAIVTIGGVSTAEINSATMESKICRGLYFAGEVMDVDGPTGGYNLTLAFATAHQAVLSIGANG